MKKKNPLADLNADIRDHIERETQDNIERGMSPEEARYAALRKFGNVTQVHEDAREVWIPIWLDQLLQDARYAFRRIRRSQAFSMVVVLILALGIGVNTALFTILRQVLLTSLPVSNPHELVEIDCNARPGATGGGGSCLHSYPTFRLLSERHEGLVGVFAFSPVPNGLVASFQGRREVVTGQLASANMFDVLGIRAAAGRLFLEADDAPGAELVSVLSHGYWLRAFGGNRDVVGRSLILDNRTVTVVGVLPRAFRGVTLGETYDLILPLGTADLFRVGPPALPGAKASILNSPNMGWLTLMGRRQPGLSEQAIGRRLEPVFRQSTEAMIAPVPLEIRKQLNLTADGLRVDVRPAALGAASNLRRTLEPTLRVLTVIAVLVLLIACANLAGLFLAQALNRQREFGLRLALGAARSRLLRQILSESLLIAAIGGTLGLLLAQWIAQAGFRLATDDTGIRAVDLAPDRWMLAFTASLSMVAGLVVGGGTVLRASRTNPQQALRNVGGPGSTRFAKVLLVAQIAFTVALVGSAALFLQTLTNFRRIDVGFQAQQLMTVTMDAGLGSFEAPRATAYVSQASTALAAIPGVRAVTYSNRAIGTGVPMNLTLDIPGFLGAADTASSGLIYAGPNFVRTLGLTLLRGRDLNATDRATSGSVSIVNESFATHFFGTVNIVGRTFAFRGPGNQPIQIIGVVKDARDRGVKRPTQRVMYLPLSQREMRSVTFTVRSEVAVSSLLPTVRRTLERLDPAVGIASMRTVDAQFDDVLRRERLLAALGVGFGVLALLLLAIGLYGMLNAFVLRRTTEIGIRVALGASRNGIMWMIARETFAVLAVGAALGLVGLAVATSLIQSQLFGIEPWDLTAAAWAVVALAIVAMVAAWLPTRWATRIEPGEALHHDFA